MSKDALCTLLVYGGHTSSEIRDWLVLAYNGTGQRDAAYGLEEARKALAKVNEAFADYDRVIADELVELRSGTPIKRVGGGGSGGRKSVDIVIGSNGLPQWPATPQPAGAAS